MVIKNCIYTNQNLSKEMWHRILWDNEIQTDHLIPTRKPDIVFNKGEIISCHLVDFGVLTDQRVKKKFKAKKIVKYQDLARELKKLEY